MIYEVVEWLENDVTTWHVVGQQGNCVREFNTETEATECCAELNDFT